MNFIQKIIHSLKDRFQEPLEESQEKARQFWMSLAPREKIILSSLAGVLGLLLVVLVLKEGATFFFDFSTQAERNMQNAERIQKLAREMVSQKGDVLRYERLLEKRGEDFNLTSYLNAEASNARVTIAKITPTRPRGAASEPAPKGKGKADKAAAPESDEDWVEVQFAKASGLEPLLQFLKSAEDAVGVRLVELEIKTDFAEPGKLEAKAVFAALREL